MFGPRYRATFRFIEKLATRVRLMFCKDFAGFPGWCVTLALRALPETAALVASGLVRGHGHRLVFNPLGLTVAPGYVVGVVETNEAGQSRLPRILGVGLSP